MAQQSGRVYSVYEEDGFRYRMIDLGDDRKSERQGNAVSQPQLQPDQPAEDPAFDIELERHEEQPPLRRVSEDPAVTADLADQGMPAEGEVELQVKTPRQEQAKGERVAESPVAKGESDTREGLPQNQASQPSTFGQREEGAVDGQVQTVPSARKTSPVVESKAEGSPSQAIRASDSPSNADPDTFVSSPAHQETSALEDALPRSGKDPAVRTRKVISRALPHAEFEELPENIQSLPNHKQLQFLCRRAVQLVAKDPATSSQALERLEQLEKPFLKKIDIMAECGSLTTKRLKKSVAAKELQQERDGLIEARDDVDLEVDEWNLAVEDLKKFTSATRHDRVLPNNVDVPTIGMPNLSEDLKTAYQRLVTNTDRIESFLKLALQTKSKLQESCLDYSQKVEERALVGYDIEDPRKLLQQTNKS